MYVSRLYVRVIGVSIEGVRADGLPELCMGIAGSTRFRCRGWQPFGAVSRFTAVVDYRNRARVVVFTKLNHSRGMGQTVILFYGRAFAMYAEWGHGD